MPIVYIIVLFSLDADIREIINLVKDLQYVIFLFSLILFMTFIIKAVYIKLYKKYVVKNDEGNIKKLSEMDLNILDDDEGK